MNRITRYITALLIAFMPLTLMAKEWQITVHAECDQCTSSIVRADIKGIKLPKKGKMKLYDVTSGAKEAIDCQIITTASGDPQLVWVVENAMAKGSDRSYILAQESSPAATPEMSVEDNSEALVISQGGKPILAYNYTMSSLPEGVAPEFSRSGYIHPIYSPMGNVLTNIQPKDHRHHYGMWNPWTRVEYDGTIYDLWNLGDGQGCVRSTTTKELFQGSVGSGYKTMLDHVIFGDNSEKVIMEEMMSVTAWNVEGGYLWDFESDLSATTALPLTIKEYRYAGFSMRATDEWTKENCDMYTSEGKTRPYIDGSKARWIYMTGQCKAGRSGILFLGHPDNYNSPEPLRIWDQNANGGRGDAFINFAPTKDMDWTISPGGGEKLRYRLFVYDGEMTPSRAEALWRAYAEPATVTIKEKK